MTLIKHGKESDKKHFEDSDDNGIIDVFEN